MQLGKFRRKFLERFISGELTPKEELLSLCSAYERSRVLRVGVAWMETDERFRHMVHEGFLISKEQAQRYGLTIRSLTARVDPDFGTKYRAFIYEKLIYSDSFTYD